MPITTPAFTSREWWKSAMAEDVNRVLATGADIEPPDKDYLSPMHLAAEVGSAEAITALINAGAAVGIRRSRGKTPLHAAARWGNSAAIRVLIKKGANPCARDHSGRTPIGVAMRHWRLLTIITILIAMKKRTFRKPEIKALVLFWRTTFFYVITLIGVSWLFSMWIN